MERTRCFEGRSISPSRRCLNGSKESHSHVPFPLHCLQRMLKLKVIFRVHKVQCLVTAEIYAASKASANGMTYKSPPNSDIAMQLPVLPLQLLKKKVPSVRDWLKLLDILPRRKKSSSYTPFVLRALPSKKEKIAFY